jgi:predicted DNA-binding protein
MNLSLEPGNVKHIHVEVPHEFKKRLDLYCVHEDMKIKEVVLLSIESFLDEMESKVKV